jgi:hypothetical protein
VRMGYVLAISIIVYKCSFVVEGSFSEKMLFLFTKERKERSRPRSKRFLAANAARWRRS